MWAVNQGDQDFVKWLVEGGADVKAPNIDGKTPLTVAQQNTNTAIIDLLNKGK